MAAYWLCSQPESSALSTSAPYPKTRSKLRPPALPRSLPVVIEAGPVRDAIEQGISTFRSLRRGEPAEKIAADAACAVMASGPEKTDSYESIEDKAYRYLPVEFRKDQQYKFR